MELNTEFMRLINKVANEANGTPYRGTSYFYTIGNIKNKQVQYTKAKANYKGRFGFWSWIATRYKSGKTKRTRIAMSGSKAKAQKRAERLLKQLEDTYGR